MARRKGMTRRRGSRKPRTLKRRVKRHQGRKRTRVGRKRHSRRQNRGYARGTGGRGMSRRLKGGVTGMKRYRDENSNYRDIKRPRMADPLGDFVRNYGNKIDQLQDNNSPYWDNVNKSWVGNGYMDYGYTKINEYINKTPKILDDIRRIITTTKDFTNFTDNNDRKTRNDNRHSDKYSKTFGDIVVVMGLHSEKIRNLLKELAVADTTTNNVKSMLKTQSMVIKNEEIKTFKYPLDNLFTLGDAPYVGDDSAGQTLAKQEWCFFLLNSCPPTTGKKFYDETNMKSVYDDFMQIAEKMEFVRKEGDSYSLVAGAGEPCEKFYENAEHRFKDHANGIFRKTCTRLLQQASSL